MNYLLAKVKGRSNSFLKVIASRQVILEIPNLDNTVDYSPNTLLDNSEWFKIDDFSECSYTNGLIENTFSITDHNQIMSTQYSDIKYLCCKQDNLFLFQKMSSTQLFTKKWINISDSPTLYRDKPIIVISDIIDAIYDKQEDILYFKDIVKIKQMFRGIEELYREATQEEVDSFLSRDFISLGNEFTSRNVKVANRRRIALALDTLNNFNNEEIITICDYTESYCINLTRDGDRFVVNSEEDLKQVLFGIEQRYYTTMIGDEKRVANSIIEIG